MLDLICAYLIVLLTALSMYDQAKKNERIGLALAALQGIITILSLR